VVISRSDVVYLGEHERHYCGCHLISIDRYAISLINVRYPYKFNKSIYRMSYLVSF